MTIVENGDPSEQDAGTHPLTVADGLTLHAFDSPCARCGGEKAITVPWACVTARHDATLQFTFNPFPRYGEPTWCAECRVADARPEDAEAIIAEEWAVWSASRAASIPRGTAIWPIYFTADDLSAPTRYRGFVGRFLAILVSRRLPPEASGWPGLRALGFSFGVFVVYETRLWRRERPGTLVFTSNPARGKESLEVVDWETMPQKDRAALMRGVDVYSAVLPATGGREPDCFPRVLGAIRALESDGRTPSRRNVALALYADALNPEDSLKKCLKGERDRSGCDTRWPAVVRAAH